MGKYFFVGASLPDLQIGNPPEMSFDDFDRLLRWNLSSEDYNKTKVLRRYWDIENLRAFWKDEPLEPRGNWDRNQIEESLLDGLGLPNYVKQYLEDYSTTEERIHNFPSLISTYFKEEQKKTSGFLRELIAFQRELRLVLVGFRAKRLNRDLNEELQFEDPEDPFIAQLLAFKDAKSFEPPPKYEDLKPIFEEHSDSPLALHQALYEYVFEEINKRLGVTVFSMDRLLGYLLQLILVEKWLELDKKKGLEIIDTFVEEQ